MRLEQKYFIPFLLIVAALCVVAIIYFNLRFMGNQPERLAERMGDGTELLETEFDIFFSDETLIPLHLADQPIVALFWASWSARSTRARDALMRKIEQMEEAPVVLILAVKDDESYIQDYFPEPIQSMYILNGTEYYQDQRIPGLPSLVVFRPGGIIWGMRFGFTSDADYDFILQLPLE